MKKSTREIEQRHQAAERTKSSIHYGSLFGLAVMGIAALNYFRVYEFSTDLRDILLFICGLFLLGYSLSR